MLERLRNLDEKKPLPWYGIMGVDLICVVIVLLIFALFHHVIPHKAQSLGSVMPVQSLESTPIKNEQTASESVSTSEIVPTVYPVGDFSATFPKEDTGTRSAFSYQTDDLRIAISRGYGTSSSYFLADIWVRNINTFKTAFANGQFATGSMTEWPIDMAKRENAILAVTGDYYGARSEGIVVRNGELYRDTMADDVCVIYADGTMETYKRDSFDFESQKARGIWQAWAFGPELLQNGQAIPEFTNPIRVPNPRCALGYYEPGHYCLIVVDGRQNNMEGMSLVELSELFANIGCKAAYNLDGGQTSAMVFNGEVINTPCDGGRKCSDIICFG